MNETGIGRQPDGIPEIRSWKSPR